jgi:hypothetical protein
VTSDSSESWRQKRIEEIRREQSERASKIRELSREIERLQELEVPLAQKLIRAQKFDPGSGHCPRCAIDNAKRSELIVQPIGTIVIGDQQADASLMRCPTCGWNDLGDL